MGCPEHWGEMTHASKKAQMGARVGNQATVFFGHFRAEFFLEEVTRFSEILRLQRTEKGRMVKLNALE